MSDTYGNANVILVALANRAAGMHYESPEAKRILDEEDWSDHWPVVDADGILTGDVVETADCEGYWNVDDMAMIADDDLRPAQRKTRHEGYVTLVDD